MSDEKSFKILIIDDDKMFSHVIKSYLLELGYETIVRNDSRNLDEAIDDTVDLILLDLYMPGQTGIDTLLQIKENYPKKPVIIMTGFSSNELKQTTTSLGAVEHLIKPFAMSVLRDKIEAELRT